jgi:glycosyltransferase involved in cell wall biosynthesis
MLLGWTGVGGTQYQALRLSAELRALGVIPVVLTEPVDGLRRRDVIDGVDVCRLGRRALRRLPALRFLGRVAAWMVRHRRSFDVVHAHNLPAALTGAFICPVLGKPLVVKLPNGRSLDEFGRRRLGRLRWILLRRYVDRFVALNDEIERRLLEHGVASRRIVRIPNGVVARGPDAVGQATATKLALGLKPDARTVIYLGRLVPGKGLAWLLEVWANVVADEPSCHLLVIGDGPEGEHLRAHADRLGVLEHVSFLGHRRDVESLLPVGDVLVLPSHSEGMSNAVLEAMACGLAVVATDVAGNRAVIDDGVNGLLVPYEDHVRLKAALLDVLRDASLRGAIGRAAARKAQSAFSMRTVARAYQDLYGYLLARRGA